MNDRETDGPWQKWSKFIIETIRRLCEEQKEILSRLDELNEKIEKYVKKEDCTEFRNAIVALRASVGNTATDLLKLNEQVKGHIDKHEYKWKVIAGLSALIGFILLIQKVIEMLNK